MLILGAERKSDREAIYTLDLHDRIFVPPESCAKDAVIIFDACSVGEKESVAEETAKINIGVTVFAPERSLCFSKPIFKISQKVGLILDHMVHGFALVNAYTSKKFYVGPTV